MNLYDLPQFNFQQKVSKKRKEKIKLFVAVILLSVFFGSLSGIFFGSLFYFQSKSHLGNLELSDYFFNPGESAGISENGDVQTYSPQTLEEQKIVKAVKDYSPAVVSIVVFKEVPIIEQYLEQDAFGFFWQRQREVGTEKKEVGGASGFIVTEDGLVVTNKHVVLEENIECVVFTNDGKKYSSKILAKDPVQDLAILRIEQKQELDEGGSYIVDKFPTIELGDSDALEIGQTVIAIGNALGEFRNTVSTGVVSGLGRRITASDSSGAYSETMDNIIQTDAAINKGNSGGPLLNLKGEVIGINTATIIGAQSIGFAIPINKVKRAVEQVKETGKIIYPFIGVRYVLINEQVKEEEGLVIDYGALIVGGGGNEPAITPDSPAQKAGLKKGDIILEIGEEKITQDNALADIILKYNPGDRAVFKILRDEEEFEVEIIFDERK